MTNTSSARGQIMLILLVEIMRKFVLIYGLSLSALILLLRYIDYRHMIHSMSVEMYVGLISVICTSVGIWMGLKLTASKKNNEEQIQAHFVLNQEQLQSLKISRREYQVLELMAKGHSNQEIAEQLFISLPTVKTHGSRLYSKLNVNRRMQAVQAAQRLGILP